MGNVLSQTCVKINNQFFDIVEGSFAVNKGHGEGEVITTCGTGGNPVHNWITKTSTKKTKGKFEILNTAANQTAFDQLVPLRGQLTIQGIDINGQYKPCSNAGITNDPDWKDNGQPTEIMFMGDSTK